MTVDELRALIVEAKAKQVIWKPYKPNSWLCRFGIHEEKYWGMSSVTIDYCQCQRCGVSWSYRFPWG